MNNDIARQIKDFISDQVAHADNGIDYRKPIVGYARADDPRFEELRNILHPGHLFPKDLLPGAKTVVSFFVPFTKQLRKANRADPMQVAPEWAVAYIETNKLIRQTTQALIEKLEVLGIRAAAEPPTHNFDRKTLLARWAHKSVAVIAGIGSFGLHQMIITDAGCLGRLGSLVIDIEIEPTDIEAKERCLFLHDGSCGMCVERCPADALSLSEKIDKAACYNRCLEVADEFMHLGYADVCGKCATGPCALGNPLKFKQTD